MKTSSIVKGVGLLLVVLAGVVVYRLGGTLIGAKVEARIDKIGLNANELAAGGPLAGDIALYAKELACQQKLPTPGYLSSLNGAEISDAQRSGIFPCASFLGSMDGGNRVLAWRSPDLYDGISYINNGRPGELYIVGGEFPTIAVPVPIGPWMAKADATTGKEVWRTYFDNLNASGRWIANANLNLLDNGNIAFAWANQIVLLDSATGRILKHNTLPAGDTPIVDVNYKHMTIAPDRTLIMKDQTRPLGCTEQGTMGILTCLAKGMKWPNSHLAAVNPDTLEVLDHIALPEPCVSPHVITTFEGKTYIYIGMAKSARRYVWDPVAKKLSADESWVIYPMKEGQSAATAPSIVGDWVGFQLNGGGSETVASSIVIASQKDAKNMKVIFPFGELKKGEWSFAPPKAGADPDNNMIYSADMGMRKVAGIKLDPATGEMKVAFVVDDTTTTFQPLVGPKDRRVLMLTNMKQNVEKEPIKLALFTENYKEQLTWRDAATGRIIAESDFFEPLTINSLTPPGFGGRVYFPSAVAKSFYTLQVMPKVPVAAK